LAAEFGCTPTQIAFAYLLCAADPPIIPLFSTTRPEHLKEILGATAIDLSEGQRNWLRGEND
jgi:aryl-alcohol dehydrogenase-like predicted oxidoreductase